MYHSKLKHLWGKHKPDSTQEKKKMQKLDTAIWKAYVEEAEQQKIMVDPKAITETVEEKQKRKKSESEDEPQHNLIPVTNQEVHDLITPTKKPLPKKKATKQPKLSKLKKSTETFVSAAELTPKLSKEKNITGTKKLTTLDIKQPTKKVEKAMKEPPSSPPKLPTKHTKNATTKNLESTSKLQGTPPPSNEKKRQAMNLLTSNKSEDTDTITERKSAAKKPRMGIGEPREDKESDGNDEMSLGSTDSLVGQVNPVLMKKKVLVPLLEANPIMQGKREHIRPNVFKPIEKVSVNKSRVLSKKKIPAKKKIPVMKQPLNRDWKIPPSGEIFPRWVKKPKVTGPSYEEFQEMHKGKDTSHYDMEGLPAHQQTREAAREICNTNMRREKNQTLLQKTLSKIKDEDDKEAYQYWYNHTERIIENEASLTYWKDDLHLKFKPSREGRRERDGELHGTFEAFVVTDDGEKRVMEVVDEWVRKNIAEEARALVI
jgi:hypothetical protein